MSLVRFVANEVVGPRRPTQQQLFDQLLDLCGPELAQAFSEALTDLKAGVDIRAFIEALERGDFEAAVEALHLDTAAFEPLENKFREVYASGGRAGVETMPGLRSLFVGFRFDVRNLRAEAWLRDHSSRLIRDILDDQRDAVRQALGAAMLISQHPRTTALEIVGRVSRVTGLREGGILGLNEPQRVAVGRARDELASGDPEQLKNYLTRKRRDRRFDRSVTKAIREGKPVPVEIAEQAVGRYGARLEQLRGETIGRSEALTGLRAAKMEAYEQLIESGRATEDQIDKTWRTTRDGRQRHTHDAMNRQSVPLRQPFKSPSGAQLMYPGDRSLGAGAGEIVDCRCDFTARINWRALL